MRSFRFNLFVEELQSRNQWQETARRAEDAGYTALFVGDHPVLPSPFPALVSAAAATTSLRLGTRVLNVDLIHPMRIAQDVATTDVLVDGRLDLGLGSGWSREEAELYGVPHRSVDRRAQSVAEAIATMRSAWSEAGDEDVACHTSLGVRPIQQPGPPIMVGGHSDAILSVAGQHADIVGFTGATLVNGHYRPTRVSRSELEDRIDVVRTAAGERYADLDLEVKVIVVAMHGAASDQAEWLSSASGLPAETILHSPFAFLGEVDEVADGLLRQREELGITSFDIPARAMDDVAPLIKRLADS